jgi:hypothetical protein
VWTVQNHAIGMFASGCLQHPANLNGLRAVAGVDWLRHETRPRPDEPEGNADHYVVVQDAAGRFFLRGPFKTGAVVLHWFSLSDLDHYWTSGT